MKAKTEKHYKYLESGLEYVYIKNVKIQTTEYGESPVISDERSLHQKISKSIILSGRPIRGKEIMFIRKSLGLNRSLAATHLKIPIATLAGWEKRFRNVDVDFVIQTFVRAQFALLLGLAKDPISSICHKSEKPQIIEVPL